MDVMNNEKWIYKSIWQSDKKYTAALDMMLCPEPLVLCFYDIFRYFLSDPDEKISKITGIQPNEIVI